MSTRLVFIRHGQSCAHVEGFIAGHQGCRGLSETGIRQVESLRDRLARTGELSGAVALYSSVLRRAVQTAEILSPVIGVPVIQECGLCELHEGDEVDGRAISEVRERYWVPATAAGKDLAHTSLTPGGESLAQFVARVSDTLRRLVANHEGGTVVIVTHAGAIRASFSTFAGLPDQLPIGIYAENTSLTEWRQEEPGSRWIWGLHRLNDSSHLAGPR